MPAALLIAANDLRRRLRDRSMIVTALVAPVALAVIVGLAFGGQNDEVPPNSIRVLLADHGDSPAVSALTTTMARWAEPGPGIVIERAPSVPQALSDLHERKASAVVQVPKGFLEREPLTFPHVHAPEDGAIAAQVAFSLAGAIQDAVVTGRRVTATGGFDSSAVVAAATAVPPVVIEDAGGGTTRSLMGYFGPAVAMVFLFFGIGVGARSVLAERQAGTLARLQAAPVPMRSIITGKLLAMLVTSAASVGIVWATTTWFLDATWGDPLGVVLLSLALVASMGALALFVTVVARNEAQADAATAAIGFGLALLGGNFFPPSSLPPVFERISLATPNGWGLQGYGALAIDGKGLGAVVTPILALLVITAVFGAVAVVRFRRAVAVA